MKIAIISGGAEGVREERDRAQMFLTLPASLLGTNAHIEIVYIAINAAGTDHPDPLHHWASLHPDRLYEKGFEWAAKREANDLGMTFVRWGMSRGGNVDRYVRNWRGGSSALHASDVALNGLLCNGAILCGCPLDDRPNAYTGKRWYDCEKFRASWTNPRYIGGFRDRLRSMSGWTAELLGHPGEAWLLGLGMLPSVRDLVAAERADREH